MLRSLLAVIAVMLSSGLAVAATVPSCSASLFLGVGAELGTTVTIAYHHSGTEGQLEVQSTLVRSIHEPIAVIEVPREAFYTGEWVITSVSWTDLDGTHRKMHFSDNIYLLEELGWLTDFLLIDCPAEVGDDPMPVLF